MTTTAFTTTALLQEPFEAMCIRNERRHLARLSFIRSTLAANGNRSAFFDGEDGRGGSLCYAIHPNCHDDRHKYPWQVTTFQHDPEDPTILIPCSHTTHKFLDLEQDWGCYYQSAVWEIAWSIAEPAESTAELQP